MPPNHQNHILCWKKTRREYLQQRAVSRATMAPFFCTSGPDDKWYFYMFCGCCQHPWWVACAACRSHSLSLSLCYDARPAILFDIFRNVCPGPARLGQPARSWWKSTRWTRNQASGKTEEQTGIKCSVLGLAGHQMYANARHRKSITIGTLIPQATVIVK